MSAKPDPAPKSWREVMPPHPAADVFPMLPEEELRELGEDIKKNGLQSPIIVWTPPHGYGEGSPEFYVLDGRNRLDAMKLVGLPIDDEANMHVVVNDDPISYVISANIMRRHLTPQERVLLVTKALASDPVPTTDRAELIDRSVRGEDGKLVGSTKGHVAKVAEAAQVSKNTARKHLESAVESGELTEEEAGVTPKPKSVRLKVGEEVHEGAEAILVFAKNFGRFLNEINPEEWARLSHTKLKQGIRSMERTQADLAKAIEEASKYRSNVD